ncbi:RES family NAD+ phosphorylase [Pseudomonas sp. CCC2.2]|uniref:RES family NAD+ phosphorylase n=1 Tax=Pseudomonas sp. CCC2.2 TaxID=3048605 RepID=UPI002B227A6C|nr:RES family NAD+ phosphorylase [Pseudomonas sp. CCC2.2]MEB0147032.1 RES family NAD+ phosphorylase [Pseudomonas sp. CCC2.2]
MEGNEAMFVCQECLGDPMLKGFKSLLTSEVICVACSRSTREALTPSRIASFIRKHLKTHFAVDDGLYEGYELTLAQVVSIAIRCDNLLVCEAIAQEMVNPQADEEDFYWPGQEYCVAPSPFESEEHERWWVVGEWNNIAHELNHDRRFFNDNARLFFDSLIYEALNAEYAECPGTPAVIKLLPSGTSFYRARIAKDEAEARHFIKNPPDELGAAPIEHAKSNRMSAAGVSLLYVAQDTKTCIHEVQPPKGATVVVGQFTSTSPLTIFDFNALSHQLKHTPLSLFSPDFQKRSDHRRLLQYLHEEIARPVELLDTHYVVTQALAECIRYNKQQAFDGISFRSVQHEGGINFVLFDKGNSQSMQAPGGRLKFGLNISSDAVTTHHITE